MVLGLMYVVARGTFRADIGSVRFFSIRVFNHLHAPTYSRSKLSRCYVVNEQEKRRACL